MSTSQGIAEEIREYLRIVDNAGPMVIPSYEEKEAFKKLGENGLRWLRTLLEENEQSREGYRIAEELSKQVSELMEENERLTKEKDEAFELAANHFRALEQVKQERDEAQLALSGSVRVFEKQNIKHAEHHNNWLANRAAIIGYMKEKKKELRNSLNYAKREGETKWANEIREQMEIYTDLITKMESSYFWQDSILSRYQKGDTKDEQ